MKKNYNFWIYIVTNYKRNVLYVGVTNDLARRLQEHYDNRGKPETFAGKCYCYNLVYHECYQYVLNAIEREKELKNWVREKKVELIESVNPEWKFLNKEVCGEWPPTRLGVDGSLHDDKLDVDGSLRDDKGGVDGSLHDDKLDVDGSLHDDKMGVDSSLREKEHSIFKADKFKYLKEAAYEANMDIPRQKLAIYTFGNVSAIDRNTGIIAIKPSGVPYSELKPDDMVLVDLENNVLEGNRRPSSDTKTHTLLYLHFENIGGICHTHSTYAVAWAQAMRAIPNFGTTHADHLVAAVPVTEVMSNEMILGDYEHETGNQILDIFRKENLSPDEVEMVLVACHGPFTWGKDAAKAVYNAAVLEELAKMAYLTLQINPLVLPIKQALTDKHYFRKHGANAYYGQ